MAAFLFADNTYGTIAAGINSSATAITLTTGHGVRFPAVSAGTIMPATLVNSSNVVEQIHITAHTASSDSITVTRAANGTTGKAWSAGDRIEMRQTSEFLNIAALLFGSTDNATTFSLLATPTTLTIGAAATTLGIGAATGTLTVNNATLAAKAGTFSGTLVVGGAYATGLTAGDIAIPNLRSYQGTNAAGNGNVAMITVDASNIVSIYGATATIGEGGTPRITHRANSDLIAASAGNNGLIYINSTDGRFVFHAGGARYYVTGTSF